MEVSALTLVNLTQVSLNWREFVDLLIAQHLSRSPWPWMHHTDIRFRFTEGCWWGVCVLREDLLQKWGVRQMGK